MMTPELGLAAFDTGVKSIELLILIIKTVQDVRKLKSECDEIRSTASILQEVLEANQDVLKEQKTSVKLEGVLVEVLRFVVECKESNLLHRAWEVMWKHRLPGLLKEMMMWIALLSAETTVSTRSDLWKLIMKADETQTQQNSYMVTILAKLQILDELKKNQDDRKSSNLEVDFLDGDSRLSVTKEDDDILYGSLELSDTTVVKVLCEPVKEELMRYGEKGPRHVLIYAKLSANTLVHPFYGIAMRFDKRYTVMKDLRECPTLGIAIRDGRLPQPVLKRLSIAYDIAKTLEYLHSVEVLVKRLSDKNVLLSSEKNTIIPYLADLDRARLFKESTSGGEYDVRYEAPEFQKLPHQQHSIYTDIWSMGILIWQCVSGTFPFGFLQEVTEGADAEKIRQLIMQGPMPWKEHSFDDSLLQQVERLVERCCNFKPSVRPSAADVAHSLFDILTLATLNIHSSPPNNGTIKARVSELLEKVDKSATVPVSVQLSNNDVKDLRDLATQGDPTAAYLLGSAIWYGLTEPGDELEDLLLIAGEDHSKEARARSSLPHLEFAMQAGVKGAAEPLMRVHGALMQLYRLQVLQYKNMKSL